MLAELTNILILSLVAGLSTGLGGLIVTLKRPGEKSFGLLIGYASGVMLVISFLGLVSEAWEAIGYLVTTISFAVGTFFTFALDATLPHISLTSEEEGVIDVDLMHCGLLLALGIAIRNLPEGVSMGASYLHAPQLGVAIALAMAIHSIPEGIATALPPYKGGCSKMKAFQRVPYWRLYF